VNRGLNYPSYGLRECVAVCCSVLQCVAVFCSAACYSGEIIKQSKIRPAGIYCSVLPYAAVRCSVLQRVAVRCSVLQSVLQCEENRTIQSTAC